MVFVAVWRIVICWGEGFGIIFSFFFLLGCGVIGAVEVKVWGGCVGGFGIVDMGVY